MVVCGQPSSPSTTPRPPESVLCRFGLIHCQTLFISIFTCSSHFLTLHLSFHSPISESLHLPIIVLVLCRFGLIHFRNPFISLFISFQSILTLSFTRNVTHILPYLLLYKTSTCFNINIFTSPNLYRPDHSHICQTHLITI